MDNIDRYMKEVKKYPLLSTKEQYALAVKAQHGDLIAREKLIISILNYVVSLAHRLKSYTRTNKPSFDDLIQAGNIGAIDAVDKFDPDKGTVLVSFATPYIKRQMYLTIAKYFSLIRLKNFSRIEGLFRNKTAVREIAECKDPDMRRNLIDEIVKYTKYSEKEVKNFASRVMHHDVSMESELKISTPSCIKYIKDTIGDNGEYASHIENMIDAKRLADIASRCLSENEQAVLNMRIYTEDTKTFREVGKVLGMSKQRVQQLESRIPKKVRKQYVREVAMRGCICF